MPKIIQPEDDKWTGVENPRKRKQIQDRLAQRARRMRLAATSKTHLIPPSNSSDSPEDSAVLISQRNKSAFNQSSKAISDNNNTIPSPSLGHIHFPTSNLSIGLALNLNGIILGIPCVTSPVQKSSPAGLGSHIPAPLRPIQIQLDEVHYSFIDRLPHKQLRYNMIKLAEEFSVEDFVNDIFGGKSFFIEEGRRSWDPEGWEVDESFRRKWRVVFEGVDFRVRG